MLKKFIEPIGRTRPFPLFLIISLLVISVIASACSLPVDIDIPSLSTEADPTPTEPSEPTEIAGPPALSSEAAPSEAATSESETAEPAAAPTAAPTALPQPTSDVPATIRFDISGPSISVDQRILGTNLPAWLGPGRVEDEIFIGETIMAGVSVIRIPGGSWSNGYDWLACETGVSITGDDEACRSWHWGLSPTDFINFIKATDTEAMYTVNQNGTSKEAAALVAFFNGSVDDDTVIGVDLRGNDWGKVSDWAQLRANNGNPEPLPVKYWEIGNEIYGGESGMGKDCLDWGWEDVWTCDGTEYVMGLGEGADRGEGFLEFYDEMKKVDPSIMIGAVGIPYGNSPDYWKNWTDWGNEVIAAAGDVMDFYIIHQYGYLDPPESYEEALGQPQIVWDEIMADLEESFDKHAAGRRIPVAVTEYNSFSVEDRDTGQFMTRAVNMLFMADTLGQMMENGFAMANQWDLANIPAWNGTDYGMIHADTYGRYPQYYTFALWSQFGNVMFPVESEHDAGEELSVYAGMTEAGTISIFAINKTSEPIDTTILIEGLTAPVAAAAANVVQAESWDSQIVTLNGVENPVVDFSDAPPLPLDSLTNPLSYQFEPYSITLLQVELAE